MLHTNCGELALLFDTYCRIWRAGGQASLTTSTKDGLVEANLKLQLGPPAAARAGAPPPSQRLSSPSSSPGNPGAARRQPCHRGPAAKAKSRARAALHQAAKAAAALASEGVSPSNPVGVAPNLPKKALPSHPDGASPSSSESSPPAASSPLSGGALSIDPVETTPTLPASEGVSSPAPLARGGACYPKPPLAPTGDLPSASGRKPAPSPGDASRFLKASHNAQERSYLHQCDYLLSSGQCCEKIFCNPRDIRSHMLKNHGTDSFEFRQKFFIDAHDNLYIL